MAKRKKHLRLPNGYGQINYLGSGRRNPYAVYPPSSDYYRETGAMKRKKALCYVKDYMTALAVLTAYHRGEYVQGMELEFMDNANAIDAYLVANRDFGGMTFKELFHEFYSWKFEGRKEYSKSSQSLAKTVFNQCSALHEIPIKSFKYNQLQEYVDNIELGYSSVNAIQMLLKQLFKYAVAQNYIDTNPAQLLKVNHANNIEHGIPFTLDDLRLIYAHRDEDIASLILCLCFTGHRINEYKVVDVDLNNWTISGGLKNRTSKERIVPIHSFIQPFIKKRILTSGCLTPYGYIYYRNQLIKFLKSVGIQETHTLHDCRHTFSKLCEDFGVRENDRKRMLGHTIGDITNDVYGHRDIDSLRNEIEKIKPEIAL